MNDDKGFTLIELLIAISLITGILLVITSFYIVGVKGFGREASSTNNQFRIRRISNEISKEIRKAEQVQVESGMLSLIYSNDIKRVYYLLGTKLQYNIHLKNSSGSYSYVNSVVIDKKIKSFTFTVTSDEVSVVVESTENTEGDTYKLETKIAVRR